MLSTIERRLGARRQIDERGRVPFPACVELLHDEDHGQEGTFDGAFEADGVDLSSGGLSLRAACLPEVGTELLCRFESVPGGTRIESRAEVVWAEVDGERSGEFGLRFMDLDPQMRALIDEAIAERAVVAAEAETPSEPRANAEVEAQKAQDTRAMLEIEGADSALSARIAQAGAGQAVFEQRLDLLELGRQVVARAGSVLGRGSIAGLSLRMDGDTPTLAVTVRFDGDKSLFGEFDLAGTQHGDVAAAEAIALDRDTVPDLDAPTGDAGEPALAPPGNITMTEFPAEALGARAEPSAGAADAGADAHEGAFDRDDRDDRDDHDASDDHDDRDDRDDHDASDEDGEDREDDVDAIDEDREDDEDALPPALESYAAEVDEDAPRIIATESRIPANTHADEPRISRLSSKIASRAGALARSLAAAEQRDPSPTPRFVPESARSSVLVRFLRILAAITLTLQRGARMALAVLGPKLRAWGTAFAQNASSFARDTLVPSAMRVWQALARKTYARPRRTTAPGRAGTRDNVELRALLRVSVLCALAIAAIALAVYALAPSAEDEIIPLHREIQPAPAVNDAPAQIETTTAPAATTKAASADANAPRVAPEVRGVNPEYARAMLGKASHPASPQAAPVPVPSAGTVPAGSPYAVDVRAAKPSAGSSEKPGATSGGALSFGHKSVPNAARFVLRMTAPVRSVQGQSDASGFTVVVPGSLSLDRAAPIRAAHKDIVQAMVLNKNNQATLTLRFADGKKPAYRVTGRGNELEILIAR